MTTGHGAVSAMLRYRLSLSRRRSTTLPSSVVLWDTGVSAGERFAGLFMRRRFNDLQPNPCRSEVGQGGLRGRKAVTA